MKPRLASAAERWRWLRLTHRNAASGSPRIDGSTSSIKNPRSKLRGIGGRKEADQKNAASCGEYVPKEIQSFQDPGLDLDRGLLSAPPAANPLAAPHRPGPEVRQAAA